MKEREMLAKEILCGWRMEHQSGKASDMAEHTLTWLLQSVRRKGGRYVYIICSKNPKHKQRYAFRLVQPSRTTFD